MDKEKYLESLLSEMPKLTKTLGENLGERVLKEANSFVDDSKENLIKWSAAMAKGELSKEDYVWLLNSKKDLLKVTALKEIGLTQIQAEKFRNALFTLVIEQAEDFLQS